ncbi:ZFPL1 protein, partial [Atractosteus spatula]|nr:ZFPL1 protein [Atractosteus spatula]
MGLCKCPKRKVTNLFCFEHRVNVCEHCLVSNHAKCVVQSYLQWLQDSDYNPQCQLCSTPLAAQDTVRLVCYDVFHWTCLNELAARLPPNTAPAGYQCPACQAPVFPPANLASPVADVLRQKLSTVNWARAGLGLPLIEEAADVPENPPHDVTDYTDWSTFDCNYCHNGFEGAELLSKCGYEEAGLLSHGKPTPLLPQHTGLALASKQGSFLPLFPPSPATAASSPRKVYDTREGSRSTVAQIDFDDDKYRRRPALSWFAQILKNRSGTKRTALTLKQRVLLVLLLGVLGFLTLIVVMSKLGRASADSDPNLDPHLNPHIRVGQN